MSLPLTRSFLTLALVGALAACSSQDGAPDTSDATPNLTATPQAPAAPAKPKLSPEQEARLKDITIAIKPDSIKDPYPLQQAGQDYYVDLKAGDKFLLCIGNRNKEPALVAVSIQGLNIDLRPAHSHEPLWQISSLTTRCLPEFVVASADEKKPALVAWNVFLAQGEDGSAIKDLTVEPAQAGRIWLGQPGDAATVDPWPGLKPETPTKPVQPPVSQPPATATPLPEGAATEDAGAEAPTP
jgi:hypothetical protein